LSVTASAEAGASLTAAAIARAWWPLAVSWLFMTSELVITTAVIARLTSPEINLAAWGLVFAISTVIQAPAQMLLPASTALSQNASAHARLRRYALLVMAVLTALHAIVVLTPLYHLLMAAIGAPTEVIDMARLALIIMIPWSFGTGYRRFQQGVLIRFGHSRVVIFGTVVRLSCTSGLLAAGYLVGDANGVVVASVAIIFGVLVEAAYTQVRAIPVVDGPLRRSQARGREMTPRRFFDFFWPLVLMTLLTMFVQALVAAALGHMPRTLESLAVWPVLFGFLMVLQSPGMAYTEVVISLLREEGSVPALRRFTFVMAGTVTLILLIVLVTPLARLWFVHLAGLSGPLARLAENALWLGALLPGLRVVQSWYQGAIMYGERTRGIMESVLLFLATAVAILFAGSVWGGAAGLYIGMAAFVSSFVVQAGWLWLRSRPILAAPQRGWSR
jgi:hypothetical protein